MSLSGCIMLLAGTGVELNIYGSAFAVLSGLSYSLFSVFSKKILYRYSTPVFIMTVFMISSFLSVPVLIMRNPVWIRDSYGFVIALYLGFFATALAYFLFTGGLRLTKASTAVTLALAEPATASLLGVFFIGKSLPYILFPVLP